MLPVTVQRPHEGTIFEIIVLGFAEESDHFRSRRLKVSVSADIHVTIMAYR